MIFKNIPFRHRNLVLALALASGGTAYAANIPVTGDCTLVAAINNANSDSDTDGDNRGCQPGAGADMLLLDGGATYPLDKAVQNNTGLPSVSSKITINGNGASLVRTLNGEWFRLLKVTETGDLTLNHVRLTGGLSNYQNGGALFNAGQVTLNDCQVDNNQISGGGKSGGGIFNKGRMTLNNSRVSGNGTFSFFPEGSGGGIFNTGVMTLNNSAVTGNNAYTDGGITNQGKMTLTKSTVSNNQSQAPSGGSGGISNSGSLSLIGSTVATNQSRNYYNEGAVGGLTNTGNMTLTRSSVRDNTGASFSGVANFGKLVMVDSQVEANFSTGGGAILNGGKATLTMTGSSVSHNSGEYYGSGTLENAGKLTISNSTIAHNSNHKLSGGGLTNFQAGTLVVTDSIISNNEANGGAGIFNKGTMTLTKSLVANNKLVPTEYAGYPGGAGVYNAGTMTLTNATLSGNSTAQYSGGGIANKGNMTLIHSTVTGNAAAKGVDTPIAAGVGIINYAGAQLVLGNSIIANSKNGQDCSNDGVITLQGNNLVEDGSCGAPLSGDPKLGFLLDNGGFTPTHALPVDSPAVNAADKILCYSVKVDQRSAGRPLRRQAECDLGAYEAQDIILVPTDWDAAWTYYVKTDFVSVGQGLLAEQKMVALAYQMDLVGDFYQDRKKSSDTCGQIARLLKHIDTDNSPDANDYVTGPNAAILASMITEVKDKWQCGQTPKPAQP